MKMHHFYALGRADRMCMTLTATRPHANYDFHTAYHLWYLNAHLLMYLYFPSSLVTAKPQLRLRRHNQDVVVVVIFGAIITSFSTDSLCTRGARHRQRS